MDHGLTLVDAFEQRCGDELAVAHACKFLIDYLSLIGVPEIARHGLDIAIRYQSDGASRSEAAIEREKLAAYLAKESASTEWRHSEYGPIHSVYAVLWHLNGPTHGGGASELISNVFEATKSSAPNEVLVRSLLEKFFRVSDHMSR